MEQGKKEHGSLKRVVSQDPLSPSGSTAAAEELEALECGLPKSGQPLAAGTGKTRKIRAGEKRLGVRPFSQWIPLGNVGVWGLVFLGIWLLMPSGCQMS